MKKLPTPVLGAHIVGHFDKKGVCQSAQKGPISKLFNICLCNIQIEKVPFYEKKIANSCILDPQCGRFQTNGSVCQSAQNGPILNSIKNFQYKIKICCGKK